MLRCEYSSRFILPAVRKVIVFELLKRGMKSKEIAKILGITPAAISQYIKGKRAVMELKESEIKEIKKIVEKGIKKGEICKICKKIWEERYEN